MNPQDKEKLRLALGRLADRPQDQEAWSTVFVSTWATAVATANRVLRGVLELAEDAAQESFLRIIRYANFKEITHPDAFLSYLKATSRNVALDFSRRLAMRADRLGPEVLMPDSEPSDALPTPEEIYLAYVLHDELIKHLDKQDQLLLDMLVDGYTVGDVCQKLRISYSAAGVRIHRLREKLRKYMATNKI